MVFVKVLWNGLLYLVIYFVYLRKSWEMGIMWGLFPPFHSRPPPQKKIEIVCLFHHYTFSRISCLHFRFLSIWTAIINIRDNICTKLKFGMKLERDGEGGGVGWGTYLKNYSNQLCPVYIQNIWIGLNSRTFFRDMTYVCHSFVNRIYFE